MKSLLQPSIWMVMIAAILGAACSEEKYEGLKCRPSYNGQIPDTLAIRLRHKDTPLKVLAIGNSFTSCAINYLPALIERLNADSVCIAKLVRSGASLDMHWGSHLRDTPDYDLWYSDGGTFLKQGEHSIDATLAMLNWDIIVTQQQSGLSGIYSSYEPCLHYLLSLFHESNPDVLTGWQCTWAYMPGANHPDFYRYEYDSEKMHSAILYACRRACGDFDIIIPSAEVIRRLRMAFPNVEDGFSTDGFHLDWDGLGCYTLSSLWYECLVAPLTGVSSLDRRQYFDSVGMDQADIDRALEIVGLAME